MKKIRQLFVISVVAILAANFVVGSIDTECQDFGFDYGVAKWQCNGGWSIEEEAYSGTSVTGTCSEANWDVGTSGADGIVVKAGNTVHYSVVGTSGTVYQSNPDTSHITFCGYLETTTTTTTTTTTSTTTTSTSTTTTIPDAAEFGSLGIAAAILLTTPAFAYLIVKKKR